MCAFLVIGRPLTHERRRIVVIRKILKHQGLWEDKTPIERAPPDLISEKSYEPYDDGWPQFEELSVSIH
jgi:hypothetical protein